MVLLASGAVVALMGRIYGYSRPDRLLMIGLTTPQAAATLAVTVTAREVGAFDDVVVDAVVLVILVTCLCGPLLSRYAGKQLAGADDAATQRRAPEEPKKDLM